MSKNPENPLAFPGATDWYSSVSSGVEHYPGMTLRDYFAAAALTGLLADSNMGGEWARFADRAYEVADAMLERRAK